MDCYGDGLQHGRFRKRKAVRQTINNPLRHDDVFRERSGATVVGTRYAEYLAAIAEIDFASRTVTASSARNRGIKGYTVALGPSGDLWPNTCNSAGSFVAHHNGWNAAAGASVVAMHVAAANTAGRHLHQKLARARGWLGEIGNLQMAIF